MPGTTDLSRHCKCFWSRVGSGYFALCGSCEARSRMPSRLDRETILVVEGDPTLGQVFCRALARAGLTIVHAADAAEALQLAAQHAPRLVLLDCNLREDDGAQLATQLQKLQAGLPVIAISDDPHLGAADALGQSPFTSVLRKSVSLQDLRQAV